MLFFLHCKNTQDLKTRHCFNQYFKEFLSTGYVYFFLTSWTTIPYKDFHFIDSMPTHMTTREIED